MRWLSAVDRFDSFELEKECLQVFQSKFYGIQIILQGDHWHINLCQIRIFLSTYLYGIGISSSKVSSH